MKFKIRNAIEKDIPFIAEAILEAERSGSEKIAICELFGKSKENIFSFLCEALKAETSNSDYSLSSYVVAVDEEDLAISTFGSWIECENENSQTSGFIKANLIYSILGLPVLTRLKENQELVNSINFQRKPKTIQFEYAYTLPAYRGQSIMSEIINYSIEKHLKLFPTVNIAQVQLFSENASAVKSYLKSGFIQVSEKTSSLPEVLNIFPFASKVLLEKKLNHG